MMISNSKSYLTVNLRTDSIRYATRWKPLARSIVEYFKHMTRSIFFKFPYRTNRLVQISDIRHIKPLSVSLSKTGANHGLQTATNSRYAVRRLTQSLRPSHSGKRCSFLFLPYKNLQLIVPEFFRAKPAFQKKLSAFRHQRFTYNDIVMYL